MCTQKHSSLMGTYNLSEQRLRKPLSMGLEDGKLGDQQGSYAH